jgi:hypothetical protein
MCVYVFNIFAKQTYNKVASILADGLSIYEIPTSGEDLLQPCFKKNIL